jgi:hypothetical protein
MTHRRRRSTEEEQKPRLRDGEISKLGKILDCGACADGGLMCINERMEG